MSRVMGTGQDRMCIEKGLDFQSCPGIIGGTEAG